MLIDSLRLIGYDGAIGNVDHIVHFLLQKLDPIACKQVSTGCWPIIEAHRDGRQFRLAATKVFLAWKESGKIKSTVRKGILDERWGHARLLGELVYELVLMVMRKECCGEDLECSYEDMVAETATLIEHIETVKAKTDEFMAEHPIPTVSKCALDSLSLDRLNDALFDPLLLPNPTPAIIIREQSFDNHVERLHGLLNACPIIPNPTELELRASSLLSAAKTEHIRLVTSHAQSDLQQRPASIVKDGADWSIENESINLII